MPRARIVEGGESAPFRPSTRAAAPGDESPEARVERAREEGRREGLEEGRALAGSELAQQLAAERSALEAERRLLADLQGQVFDLLREEIVALVAEVASRILHTRLDSGDPVVERTLGALLESRRPASGAEFVCHPDDAPALREALGEAAEARGWGVSEDPGIARGGLLVRAEGESVDARVETLLRRCVELLRSEESLA